MKAKRYYGGRRDGERINAGQDLTALFPYMFKRRCESVIYFSQDIDMEPMLAYIEKRKAEGADLGFFPLFIAALVRVLFERDRLNRFIIGRRLYQRDYVDISTVAKRQMTDDGEESLIRLRFRKADGFREILQKLRGEVKTAKGDEPLADDDFFSFFTRLPRFALRAVVSVLEWMDFYWGVPKDIANVDPMRASAFVANMGSIGIDANYHHLYEWGTCSLFVNIGRIQKKPVVLEDDTIVARNMVQLCVTMDERITDGYYSARSFDLLKHYLTHPEEIENYAPQGDTL